MPYREAVGGVVYHVMNRSSGGIALFHGPSDFKAFERVLAGAHEQVAMRTIAYCVMPNHWHFVLWPREDGDLSVFMHWLTMTHAKRWHAYCETTGSGHVYQGPYKSVPVESDDHLLTVCRYVERNALRAGLVARAEDWPWCSLHKRQSADAKAASLLSDGPIPRPSDWLDRVNRPLNQAEFEALRKCIRRGRPFGTEGWVKTIARRLGLESALRPRGRPRRDSTS